MTQAVLMYTTAVCPYCIRAKQLLAARGVTQIRFSSRRISSCSKPRASPIRMPVV